MITKRDIRLIPYIPSFYIQDLFTLLNSLGSNLSLVEFHHHLFPVLVDEINDIQYLYNWSIV